MMKFLLLLIACLVATSAFAVIDPDDDHLGVYFDLNADMVCGIIGPNIIFNAYVTITYPSLSNISGIEFGYRVVPGIPGMLVRQAVILPSGAIDVGNSSDPTVGYYVMGLAAPIPASSAVQMVTWKFYLLTPMSVDFFLGPAAVQSILDGLPAYIDSSNTLLPLGISSGSAQLPVAMVNRYCMVVDVEETSFGSIKSLYR